MGMRPTSISSDCFCLISNHFWVCQFLLIYQCWRGCAQIACHLHGALHTSESYNGGTGRSLQRLCPWAKKSLQAFLGIPTEMQLGNLLCWEFPGYSALGSCPPHQPNHLTANGKASSSHYTFLPPKTKTTSEKVIFSQVIL